MSVWQNNFLCRPPSHHLTSSGKLSKVTSSDSSLVFFFTPGSEIDSSTKRSPEESSVGTLTNEGSGVAFEEVAAVPDGGFESSAFSKLLDLV